ncbi:MAG: PIN domain-containing protein [Verrucomicrobiota bacterium]
MSVKIFLDTNVIVYAFDKTSRKKQTQARELLQIDRKWAVSWQVVQEFSSVALHRFKKPLSSEFLANFIDLVLWPKCSVMPSQAIFEKAIIIREQTQYRFYDALIIAAAIESGATKLLSEDLQDGRAFGELKIVNPFG